MGEMQNAALSSYGHVNSALYALFAGRFILRKTKTWGLHAGAGITAKIKEAHKGFEV